MRLLSQKLASEGRRDRGQILLVGALFVLLLSFMLMMILTISWGVRQRIRLQNAADAQAYSQAVVAARAMNYVAYSNRAIAGALVSMSIISAYESEMSAEVDLYWSHWLINWAAAGCEIGICCSCPWGACCKIKHCWHALEDFMTGLDFLSSAGDIASEVQALDKPFKGAIDGFKTMIQLIYLSQVAVIAEASKGMVDGAELGDLNIWQSATDKSKMVGGLSAGNFMAVFDPNTSAQKTKDMADVANSARSDWTRERGWQSALVLAPLTKKIKDKDGGNWIQFQVSGMGSAGVTRNGSLDPQPNTEADGVSSQDWWMQAGACQHNCCPGVNSEPGMWPISLFYAPFSPAYVSSENGGGDHTGGMMEDPHNGSQHKLDKNTIFKYVSLKLSTSKPYGQPAIYGYASGDIAHNDKGQNQPWTITSSGKTRPEIHGRWEELNFKGGDKGSNAKAISKALVYYHRPGYWREPPNLFNPYWRAKLHPFTRFELGAVAAAAGDSNAAVLMTGAGVAGMNINISQDGF